MAFRSQARTTQERAQQALIAHDTLPCGVGASYYRKQHHSQPDKEFTFQTLLLFLLSFFFFYFFLPAVLFSYSFSFSFSLTLTHTDAGPPNGGKTTVMQIVFSARQCRSRGSASTVWYRSRLLQTLRETKSRKIGNNTPARLSTFPRVILLLF